MAFAAPALADPPQEKSNQGKSDKDHGKGGNSDQGDKDGDADSDPGTAEGLLATVAKNRGNWVLPFDLDHTARGLCAGTAADR
jgi:hypothetical protein